MNSKKKSIKNSLSSKKGMTLVEVLVAMTLLVLIVLVFTPLFMTYFRNTRTAGQITQKTYERASIMERLIANPDGSNDTGYETSVAMMPITLTAGATTVDFTNTGANSVGKVHGTMVTESINDDNSYVSFYTPSTDSTMVSFPASLTDDFITKDITVVPKGFKFSPSAENKNSVAGYHFEVYNTLDSGAQNKVSTNYYDIEYANDGDGGKVAIFTFKGANDVISFERSPLWIRYCGNGGMLYQVKVEIGAPEIILVGEKANDGDYYYYATEGVDIKTGQMDIIAKKMSGAPLNSAMNDVEWVAKGEGDNGSTGKNEYGYYIMGGDAGQVRRFWRNETTGNYYWGGDYLYNYDSFAYYSNNSGYASGSYETFSRSTSPTTQATFKKIVRANQDQNTTNGINVNTVFDSSKFSITGADWKAITSNYFTANVTSADQNKFYVTLGRVLNVGWAGGGTTGRSGMDYGATKAENDNLRTWLTYNTDTGKNFTVEGYKSAVDYEYPNDTSLVTITSVGAIQMDSKTRKYQENSSLKNSVYPTQSYTLYCGYVPAVLDLWGYTNHGNINGNWIHEATLGVATDGDEWYPTGKFGDSFAVSNHVSDDTFPSLEYKDLLNYRVPDTDSFNNTFPAPFDGGGTVPRIVHHDAITHLEGMYTHTVAVSGTYNKKKGWFGSETVSFTNEELTLTVKGQNYDQEGTWTWDQVQTVLANRLPDYKNTLNITKIEWSKIDGKTDPYFPSQWHLGGKSSGVGLHDDSGNSRWRSVEVPYRDTVVDTPAWDETVYDPVAKADAIWYYGPNATLVADTMAGHTHKVESAGTALPYLNNYYYITDAREVDITLGYLSYPYAIGVQTPGVPQISGTNGSDYYFSCYGHGSITDTNSKYDHSFFSGGLRDNVTMLDVKSYRDSLSGETFSLAGGYTLSYIFGDGKTGSLLNVKHTTYLSQVYNTGIVYLRGTGDGNNSDTVDSMESGKGWSLGHSSNVFHQFYGTDQYRDKNGLITNENNNGPLGWDTSYHRAYFNISIREDTPPSASTSPGRTPGEIKNNKCNYGINCHPMQGTEVTTVNWGTTWDCKPQAMWGTANGTLLSWFYDYENKTNSKITSVKKEFESYIWADRYGNLWNSNKNQFYDYPSQENGISGDYGFISVLKSINDVCYCDDVWVAVGDQSGKAPSQYCAGQGAHTCVQSSGLTSGASNPGSFVNVKFIDKNMSGNVSRWIMVKISDQDNVNIRSVVNCQGVWYLMGYVDVNDNGKQDSGDRCVMYFSRQPQDGFKRCATRTSLDGDYTGFGDDDKTYALYFDTDGTCKQLELTGVNKMACQS